MFHKVDIMDDPLVNRTDIDDVQDEADYDPEDEYHNEYSQSGLHPDYAAFDDPDEIDEDFIL